MKHSSSSQAGFTLVESLAALTIFALSLAAVSSLAASLQQAHRNNQYLVIATTAARDIIEVARNTKYGELKYGETLTNVGNWETIGSDGSPVKLLPSTLPEGSAQLTTSYTAETYALKRIEVTVTYKTGTDERSVKLSSFLGLSGITQ